MDTDIEKLVKAFETRRELLAAFDNTIEIVEKLDKAEKVTSFTGSGLTIAGKT